MIDGPLDGWENTGVRQGRPQSASSNTQLRLVGCHFIATFENTKYKPDCTVCSDRKNKKRCLTSYYSKQCNVLLCVVPCFESYHSLVNYKCVL